MASRIFPLMLAFFIVQCGTSRSSSSQVTSDGEAAINTDELLTAGRKSVEFVNSVWEQIPTGTLEDVRSLACTGSLGHTLKDINSLEFSVGVDPVKYFPGVGRVIGAQANLTYSFFRLEDGNLQGQAYFTPQLKGGYTSSLGDVRVGWSWGCQGNAEQRQGYFANVGVGGITASFGVDAGAAFDQALTDGQSEPVSFSMIQNQYFAAAQSLSRATQDALRGGRQSKSKYTSNSMFYSSATPASIAAAIRQADRMLFKSKNPNAEPVSLGVVLRQHLDNTQDDRLAKVTTETTKLLRELMPEIAQARSETMGSLLKGILQSKLTEALNTLEAELHEMAKVHMPVHVQSRGYTVDQKKLLDVKQAYLDDIRKTHGYYTMLWVEDVLKAQKLRFEGAQKLRLLLREWLVQFNRSGRIDAGQTVGGIHNAPVFHGCNYLNMSPTGLSNYRMVVTAPARLSAAVLSPFRLLTNVMNLPFRTIKSMLSFKEVIADFKKSAGVRLNETTVGISHAYVVPYSQWQATKSNLPYVQPSAQLTSKSMNAVRNFFSWTCGSKAEDK